MRVFREALESIQKRPLKEWEIAAIQMAAAGHLEHIHEHHTNEDEIFAPALRVRFRWPDKIEAEHKVIVQKLNTIESIIQNLKKDVDTVDTLLKEWNEYEAMMEPHFCEEEQDLVPLMRAYFTQEDIKPIIMKLVAKSPKQEIGSMVYFKGEESFRNEFMPQEGIPFFVWYIDFQFKLAGFKKEFLEPLEALKKGEEPKKEASHCILL